jgi:hypothetical protein
MKFDIILILLKFLKALKVLENLSSITHIKFYLQVMIMREKVGLAREQELILMLL